MLELRNSMRAVFAAALPAATYLASIAFSTASTPLAAQGKVVPKQFLNTEGGGNSEAPGDWAPIHMQSLYLKAAVPNGVGLVTGIAVRPDSTTNSFRANTRTVTLEMSTAGVPDPEFSSAIYAGNRGTDHRVVFSASVNFPALMGANGPRPFNVRFPFRAPFAYAVASNLLLEWKIDAASFSSQGWRADATPGVRTSPAGQATNNGMGCPTSFAIRAQGLVPWPGALARFEANPGLTSAAPYLLVIGTQALNIDLTSAGAPGCRLYQDLAIVLSGASASNGIVTLDFGRLPEDPNLKGAFLPMQLFVLDTSFNQLGFRASAGYSMTLGAGFPAGLEAQSWYDRRPGNSFARPDFRSTRSPIFMFF